MDLLQVGVEKTLYQDTVLEI